MDFTTPILEDSWPEYRWVPENICAELEIPSHGKWRAWPTKNPRDDWRNPPDGRRIDLALLFPKESLDQDFRKKIGSSDDF
ncbi:MAG: hypothetical protein M1493_12045 [Firmicutes bacterium]|jgi:hypothetical protein|nr:hypothetical protein [Bacillota bacterium]